MSKKVSSNNETKAIKKVNPPADDPAPLVHLDMEADSGGGFQGVDRDSFSIPFLTLLQKTSPQLDPDNQAKYVEGAKVGDYMNSVTGKNYGGNPTIIPCAFQRIMNEWVPRDQGGGFKGTHSPSDPIVLSGKRDERGKFKIANGNELSDTRNHFCLVVDEDGSVDPVVFSLTSTQIKKSKNWMTEMQQIKIAGAKGLFNPPTFSHFYHLSSVPESNDFGNWRGVKIDRGDIITNPDLYNQARIFSQQVNSGKVRAEEPHIEADAGPATSDRDVSF